VPEEAEVLAAEELVYRLEVDPDLVHLVAPEKLLELLLRVLLAPRVLDDLLYLVEVLADPIESPHAVPPPQSCRSYAGFTQLYPIEVVGAPLEQSIWSAHTYGSLLGHLKQYLCEKNS
jgi:hypothetical protein